jgi:hypothetical protein
VAAYDLRIKRIRYWQIKTRTHSLAKTLQAFIDWKVGSMRLSDILKKEPRAPASPLSFFSFTIKNLYSPLAIRSNLFHLSHFSLHSLVVIEACNGSWVLRAEFIFIAVVCSLIIAGRLLILLLLM